jgi:hypothetical protein
VSEIDRIDSANPTPTPTTRAIRLMMAASMANAIARVTSPW